jgi:hypothetical protein
MTPLGHAPKLHVDLWTLVWLIAGDSGTLSLAAASNNIFRTFSFLL